MALQQNNHKHLSLSAVNAITVFTKPKNRYLGQNQNTVIQPVMAYANLKTLGPFMHSVWGMKAKEKTQKIQSYHNAITNESAVTHMCVWSHGDKY